MALENEDADIGMSEVVQALVDLAENGGDHAKGIVGALEKVALAAGSNAAVVKAITDLRNDLRERAETTELVMTATYNREGQMTGARITREKKA
jgi:hypothetical protein